MTLPLPVIDKPLIMRLMKGDENAFKMVYGLYYDKLYFYCLQFVKSEDLARELLQDVFIKIWTQREQINPDLSLNAYFYKITRNHTLDFLKKMTRERQLMDELIMENRLTYTQSVSVTEDKLIYADYAAIANIAISQLPKRRRLIFQLSRTSGMSYEEIAINLGISKNTVKVQMLRALKTIRKYLQINTDLTISVILCIFLSFKNFS